MNLRKFVIASVFLLNEKVAFSVPEDLKTNITVSNVQSMPFTDGPSANFTGTVKVQQLFGAHDPSRMAAGSVTFSPKARSAWHTHPLGQILMVSEGSGWVQEWGRPAIALKKGDVVWTAPGVKHWHGASSDTSLTHTALQENKEGKTVDWLEKVSDAQYEKAGK